jgi:hypothetical protein
MLTPTLLSLLFLGHAEDTFAREFARKIWMIVSKRISAGDLLIYAALRRRMREELGVAPAKQAMRKELLRHYGGHDALA